MLEAEARWHSMAGSRSHPRPTAFVEVSSKQIAGLREHHRSTAVHKHRRFHAKQQSAHDHIQVTGLSGLDSQFVGPIGVGTVAEPAGCVNKRDASLVYVPAGSSSTAQVGSCSARDESQVWVIFDSGSTNLWIASDLCYSHACQNPKLTKYDHRDSISFEQTSSKRVNIKFGTGAVSGPQAIEDFHVGPFTVYSQNFGMIETEDGNVFESLAFGGILGLAFPEMATGSSRPFFDSLIEQRVLDSNVFTFYFSMNNPSANAIFWGGVDDRFHEGEVEYFNVTDRWYWSVELKGLWVGDHHLIKSWHRNWMFKSPKAIVDTGTTFFTAEGAVFDQIIGLLPERPCSQVTKETHPDVTIMLQNSAGELRNFTFTNNEYMTAWGLSEDTSYCTSAFMKIDLPARHGPGVILGEVFIRYFLTVFDRGNNAHDRAQVGFARAKHGEEVEDHLRTLTSSQALFPGVEDHMAAW